MGAVEICIVVVSEFINSATGIPVVDTPIIDESSPLVVVDSFHSSTL